MDDATKALDILDKAVEDFRQIEGSANATAVRKQISIIGSQLLNLGTSLKNVSKVIVSIKSTSCEHHDQLAKDVRVNRDLIDDQLQITFVERMVINIVDEDIRKEISVTEQADYGDIQVDKLAQAMASRYNVKLTSNDFYEARQINKKGHIQVGFNTRVAGSPFHGICLAMRAAGANSAGRSLYSNFLLTYRRRELLYNLQMCWKDSGLSKFYVDFDGTLSYLPLNSNKKIKLTSVLSKDTGYNLWTSMISELQQELKIKNKPKNDFVISTFFVYLHLTAESLLHSSLRPSRLLSTSLYTGPWPSLSHYSAVSCGLSNQW